MPKPAHYRGTYHARSRALVAAAYADPDTRCWRCGLRLHQHPRTRTGRPPRWSAGHLIDGQIDGPLLPEVLSCNARAGQRISAMRRRKYRPQPPRITSRTWTT